MNITIEIDITGDADQVVALINGLHGRKPSKDEIDAAIKESFPEFKELVTEALSDKGVEKVSCDI